MRILILVTVIASLVSCKKKDSITRFSEEHQMEKALYIYPSTLRMVNLKQNPDYNEFIEGLEKARYFSLKNNGENEKLIEELKADLLDEGYEEAITFRDKNNNAVVYVQDKKTPHVAAVIEMPEHYNVIDMVGMVNIAKIPALLESFNDKEFLNVIDITEKDKERKQHRVEQHTEDQQPD